MNKCDHERCIKITTYFSPSMESWLCEEHRKSYEVDEVFPKKKVNDEVMNNPLRVGKYRNKKCLCGSNQKVKNCCGPHVKVPINLGMFWTHVLERNNDLAEVYAKLWAEDLRNAHNEVKARDL